MASLRKTQRILSGLKLIGNFVERPLRVGDIVINDDGQHLIWANIEDVIDAISEDFGLEDSQVYRYNTSGYSFIATFGSRTNGILNRLFPESAIIGENSTRYNNPKIMYLFGG